MRWRKQWKNTVMRTWLISYCLILLIPILFNLVIYQKTISLIREEINVANGALLSEIRRGMDNILRSVEELSTDIAMNSRVKELAKQSAPFSDSSYYQAFQLSKEFGLQGISKNSVVNYYVYFKKSDYIISAVWRQIAVVFIMCSMKAVRWTIMNGCLFYHGGLAGSIFPCR